VQKHGWYVKGLEPAGQSWNSSVEVGVEKSRVPNYIQGLVEKELHGLGVGLHDLAVCAATMVDFVHNEVLTDVMDLYKHFGLSTTSPLKSKDHEHVIRAFMLQLVDMGNPIESLKDMKETEHHMIDDFPAWGDLQLWMDDMQRTAAFERSRSSLTDSPPTAESIVEEAQQLNDRLGAFQDIECRSLKAELADIEYKNTGRVLLADFYHAGLDGVFLFNENVDYLRRLGALEESDPKHPSVIIVNYLASQANCLASNSFHSVCCIDECEGLLAHLEQAIASPSATPDRIAELVAGLRSDTVDAPRTLSASLLSRLGEIADHHDGVVPLHGRLFAQWMHHAYPLECPYPHASGTMSPLTPDEWMDLSGQNEVAADRGDRVRLIQHQKAAEDRPEAALPWTVHEELVMRHQLPQAGRAGKLLRKLAAFVAVVAMSVVLVRAFSRLLTSPCQTKTEKCHMV